MKKAIITTLCICISFSLFAGGQWKDLKKAMKLRKEGKYKEALKEHILFHEESKAIIGMGGVRLSYAIEDWVKLSQKYPPALTALIALKDKNKKLLLTGNGDFKNFQEFSSINRSLKKEDETYKLFLLLDKKFPKLAHRYFIIAKDLVMKHKNYQLYAKYLKDSIGEYEKIRSSRENILSMIRTNKTLNTPEMKKYTDNHFVESTCQLIEVLVGLNRDKEAEEIQRRALQYFKTPKIKSAIVDAKIKIKTPEKKKLK